MQNWTSSKNSTVHLITKHRCNVYLIQSNEQNILIDTSTRSNLTPLTNSLNLLEVKTIDFLILTHLHYDHCQSAHEISDKYGCKIIFSHHELIYAKNGFTPVPKGTNPFTRIVSFIGNKFQLKKHHYHPFKANILITNDSFKIADSIQIIQTPGHSKGSLSVIIDNEIALVGDTLFGIFPSRCFPPFAENITELIRSWEKLLDTDCTFFLPGHGQAIHKTVIKKELQKA